METAPPSNAYKASKASCCHHPHPPGGSWRTIYSGALSTVETLNLNTLQWSSASRSPKPLRVSSYDTLWWILVLVWTQHYILMFCGRTPQVLQACLHQQQWWWLCVDYTNWHSCTMLGHSSNTEGTRPGYRGSDDKYGGNPTGAIHCYDRNTNSWSVIGEMPTPRSCTLVTVLPSSNELIVVGDMARWTVEIAHSD